MKNLCVLVNNKQVGYLEREGKYGSKFTYDANVDPKDALSLNMPPRMEPYVADFDLLPVFDVNLPEGFLMGEITKDIKGANSEVVAALDVLKYTRATQMGEVTKDANSGKVDAFDVLEYTGATQIGRIKVLPEDKDSSLDKKDTPKEMESLLGKEATAEFIKETVDRHALTSGVSGAMPKVMPVSEENTPKTPDSILKFDHMDYPFLSLNEFYCLEVARASGLEVVNANLNKDARMLMVERFDVLPDGKRLGFEDFASLNNKTSKNKYDGSVETALFKTLGKFSGENKEKNLVDLFRLCVVNFAIRNGDAHLKNFALLYEDAENGPFTLSPCYDLVTTTVYLKKDLPALMFGGSKRWIGQKKIIQLGMERANLSKEQALTIIEEVGDGMRETLPKMLSAFESHGASELGNEIAEQWNDGLVNSLGVDPYVISEENGMKCN